MPSGGPSAAIAAVGGEDERVPPRRMKPIWRASFSGRQRSSASRKAMKRPRAARMPPLRAAAAPPLPPARARRIRGSPAASARGDAPRAVGRGVVDEQHLPVGKICARTEATVRERRGGVPDRGDDGDGRGHRDIMVRNERVSHAKTVPKHLKSHRPSSLKSGLMPGRPRMLRVTMADQSGQSAESGKEIASKGGTLTASSSFRAAMRTQWPS